MDEVEELVTPLVLVEDICVMAEEGCNEGQPLEHVGELDCQVESEHATQGLPKNEKWDSLEVYLVLLDCLEYAQVEVSVYDIRRFKQPTLSSRVSEAALVHSDDLIARLSKGLSLVSKSFAISTEPVQVKYYSLPGGTLRYRVSIGHECDLLIVLHHSELEDVGLWPGNSEVFGDVGLFLLHYF